MPSGDIVIVYAYLDTLADNCHTVADMLADSSEAMRLSFPKNDEVTTAYDDFLDQWDRHRSKLEAGVRGMGDAVQVVSDAFSQTEDKLISALDGDGG